MRRAETSHTAPAGLADDPVEEREHRRPVRVVVILAPLAELPENAQTLRTERAEDTRRGILPREE
eukprot:6492746-Alexandrium_andersonii.AAC.1